MSGPIPILEGQFEQVLRQIENIGDTDKGAYYVFAPDGITTLELITEVVIALLDTFGDEVAITLPNGIQMGAVIDVITLQSIAHIYLENHPNATAAELAQATNYYLNNDAYLE